MTSRLTISQREVSRRSTPAALVGVYLLISLATAGQTVVAPPQYQVSGNPSVPLSPQVGGSSQPSAPATAARTAPGAPLFALGPVNGHAQLGYRAVYATGMLTRPGHTASSLIQSFSPGVAADVGRHWQINYQPTWSVYSSSDYNDTLDHAATVVGQTEYEDWTLRFSQLFSRTSQPLVETGRQTEVESHTTSGSVFLRIGRGWMLETEGSQLLTYTTEFTDTKQWQGMQWVHSRVTPEVDVAVGGGGGYVELNNGSDSKYFQVRARLGYQAGEKINLQATVGIDRRRTTATRSHFRNAPIATANLNYTLSERTSFFAEAGRSLAPSYISSQTTTAGTLSAGVRQVLYRTLHVIVAAGYRRSSYKEDDQVGFARNRRDNNRWIDARVGGTLMNRINCSGFYRYTENRSNEFGYTFSSDQVGVELGYRY